MSRGTNSKADHAAGTDAFLLQVVREDGRPDYQSVDHKEHKQAAHVNTAPQDRSLYHAIHATPTYTNGCSRCLVATWSIALFLIGITAVVLGVLQTTKHNVLPVFPESLKFAQGSTLYITGAAFGGLGLIGILACKTRVRVVAYFFALVMTILAVGFLGVGTTAVLYKTDTTTIDWASVWKVSVQHNDAKFICQVQEELKCSGYDTCCNAPRYTGAGATGGTNATCTTGPLKAGVNIADVCSAECPESNKYTDTCDGKIKTFFDGVFIAATAVGFGMFVVFVILACGSCRMTTKGY